MLHWRHTLVEAGSRGTLASVPAILPVQYWHIQLALVDSHIGHNAALSAVPQLVLCAQAVALYGKLFRYTLTVLSLIISLLSVFAAHLCLGRAGSYLWSANCLRFQVHA